MAQATNQFLNSLARITLLALPYHESSEENCRKRGKLRSEGIKNVHVIEEGK